MVVGFLNIFLKYQLTFFSASCRLSAGITGKAKAMFNMNRATIYREMDIKCKQNLKTAGQYEYKVYS